MLFARIETLESAEVGDDELDTRTEEDDGVESAEEVAFGFTVFVIVAPDTIVVVVNPAFGSNDTGAGAAEAEAMGFVSVTVVG